MEQNRQIKVIIGLGNPGPKYAMTRHNIGFIILDALADQQNIAWNLKNNMEIALVNINNKQIHLIKPQTFMNNSGEIVGYLKKQGVQPEQVLVVHDELEKSFGTIGLKQGGSARGHNGLKSIISYFGDNFWRLRIGIGRPERKEHVADYVLEKFSESPVSVEALINQAAEQILKLLI